MTVYSLQPGGLPWLPTKATRRLLAAACASLVLHGLLLAWYQRHLPADGTFLSEIPPRQLNANLRPLREPAAEHDMSDGTKAKGQGRFEIPAARPRRSVDATRQAERHASEPDAAHAGAGDFGAKFGAPPSVDIDAAHRIARQMDRAQSPSLAQELARGTPPSDERDTVLGRAIAKSARPDCRSAYAGAGLFAIPFLIRDAVGDSGCRW